jgi:predicted dinucleotide-binding enzyme
MLFNFSAILKKTLNKYFKNGRFKYRKGQKRRGMKKAMKIGIIGTGHIGGYLASEWAKAGHEVMISSRHPHQLKELAKKLGSKVKAGTPEEAAQFGEIILLSIPFGEIAHLSQEILASLKGKIVMDTCNPYIERDKKAAEEALNAPTGSGVWTAKHLPEAKVVKAFNTIYAEELKSEAHRKGDPIGVPLASDHQEALEIVSTLVVDAGCGPHIVGKLHRAKEFDNGTEVYGSGASVNQLKKMFAPKRRAA